jgi:hypothetical protein
MPDSVPGVTFDDDGLCNLCRDYHPPRYLGEEKLSDIFSRARGKNREYDCIVPISGGRDSTYVLYLAKNKYDLKPLAVNYDNDFREKQAVINMHTACERLGVRFYEVQSKRRIARKIVREEIRFNLRRGLFAVSEILCGACAYGYRSAVYKTALKFRIPLIIWGSSDVESTPPSMMKAYEKIKQANDYRNRGSKFGHLFDITYIKLRYYQLLQRIEFHIPGNSFFGGGFPELKDGDIQEISLFDYLPWDRHQIKETIVEKAGWRKPQGKVSSWRSDCQIPPLINYCLHRLFGMSKSCIGYSNMINDNQMSREEALVQEEAVSGEFTEELRRLLEERIGLTRKETKIIEESMSASG